MSIDIAVEAGGFLVNNAFCEGTLGYVSFVFGDKMATKDFSLLHVRWVYGKYLHLEVCGLNFRKDLS